MSQLCKDNISESARGLRKNLMESYHDLHKTPQSRNKTLNIKEKKPEETVTTGQSEENKTSKVNGSNHAFNKDEVQSGSEIEILCGKADDSGLRNYVVDHMKKRVALQKEWFVAVFKAPVAAKLMMNALEPPFSWGRKACTGLLESLYRIFGKDDSCDFPSDVKDLAREIAKAWKDRMNLKDNTSRSGRANVFAFLKLLATFKIAADYERNELWGLLLAVSRNAQNLVRCLGLSPNVSEFIDMLSNDGQQVDALKYANAFGMLDKIDPVDLLTSYLRDVEKAGKEVVTNAQGMAASQAPDYMARLQRDEDIKLRAAVRAVIELLRKYGLDSHFFEDKLRKLEQENNPEEQPEPGTKGKNNESKTSKVTVLNPGISNLEQEEEDRLKNSKNAGRNRTKAAKKNAKQEEDGKKAAEKKLQEKEEKEDGNKGAKKKAENIEEKEDGNKGAKKKAKNLEEKEDGKKASEKKAQEIEEREDGKKAAEKKAQEMEEKEDGKKAAEKRAQEKEKKEGGKKDAEKKAQEKEDGNKVAGKEAQEKEDGKKDAGKKAQEKAGKKNAEKKSQEKEDGEKDAEKKAQEKEEQEDGKKDDAEKKAQHKRRQSFETGYKLSENEKYASKRAKDASSNEITRAVKQKAEQEEDGKKASEKKAQEEEDGKNATEKKAQVKEGKEDGNKAAEKKAQVKEEREVGRKAAENKAQHKRRQSFQPGYGLSESENYASKRAKETTRVVGGMDNSKPSPYNIDGVQYNYGLIGHDHHPSACSAANSGIAAGAFASVPSIGAQINNERRRHEGNPLVFGTSNLAPIGSSLYRASVPAGPFAVPLSNVAAVNYDGRGQQSYAMNFIEVDKNHVRTSVYGTRDLSNSLAMQNNYNFEGRGKESYELNFGEIHNNPVRASSYVTGVSTNSSATQCHYERRVPELYTSTFGGGNTAGIGSSVYESNPCTIPSGVNHGSHERSLGQSSSFAGQNAVPVEPSGYGSALPTVPPSSVSQGHFERRGSVINKYTFNSG